MAKGYHKLLAYKDEYEVARLHAETLEAAVAAHFTDVRSMRFHLAPPFLGGWTPTGGPASASSGRGCCGRSALLAPVQVAARHAGSIRSATPRRGGWSGR